MAPAPKLTAGAAPAPWWRPVWLSRLMGASAPKGAPQAERSTDPLKVLAEALRGRSGLETRWAVQEDLRVEYFRSKDLVVYFRERPTVVDALLPSRAAGTAGAGTAPTADRADTERALALGSLLLRRNYCVRADRVNKTIKSGRNKLSKWPSRLEMHPEQVFVEDGFYIWLLPRRTSGWMYVGSAALLLFTFACCLFPIAPYWVKLSVLYLCVGLLGLIVGLFAVRAIIFALAWALVGKRLWLLPNLLSDDVPIDAVFSPVWGEDNGKDGSQPPPKLSSRLVVVAGSLALTWALWKWAPQDTGKRAARGFRRGHDAVLEMLSLMRDSRAQLAGPNGTIANGTTLNSSALNATAGLSSNGTVLHLDAGGAEGGSAGSAAPGEGGGESEDVTSDAESSTLLSGGLVEPDAAVKEAAGHAGLRQRVNKAAAGEDEL